MAVVPIVIEGELLDQDVDAIVNAWNRNLIPWWLLSPHGVSGALKKRAGTAPFHALSRHGLLPLVRAGVGGGAKERVLGWMRDELARLTFAGEVRIVRYRALK